MNRTASMLLLVAAFLPTITQAQSTPALSENVVVPLTISQLRSATAGNWTGQLEYLDYQANQWFGIPMTVAIEPQIDRVTVIRKSEFDDGPVTGMVQITTVSLVNDSNATESSAIFRKNRPMDADVWQVRLAAPARDLTHWTIIAETNGKDGNGQAKLRETTTRDGDSLVTLKEVNPDGDGKDEYFVRNRTRLLKVAPTPR
jgi:hypothetical protein